MPLANAISAMATSSPRDTFAAEMMKREAGANPPIGRPPPLLLHGGQQFDLGRDSSSDFASAATARLVRNHTDFHAPGRRQLAKALSVAGLRFLQPDQHLLRRRKGALRRQRTQRRVTPQLETYPDNLRSHPGAMLSAKHGGSNESSGPGAVGRSHGPLQS
jgi:hypothetical protein